MRQQNPQEADLDLALVRGAIKSSLDGFVMHDGDRVTWCNPAAVRIWGKDLKGTRLSHLFATRMSPQSLAGKDTTPLDVQVIPEDGNGAHAVLCPLEGATAFWVRDLQQGEEASRAMRHQVEKDSKLARLEEMNRFKTQLLNTAAHELNTPLTPLRLQVHLLRSGTLGEMPERQAKAVKVLERNVERLALLVGDILDVARLESGHLRIEPQQIALGDVVHDAIQSYEETARGLGVGLRVDADQNLIIEADPRRLGQILFNLISNALKFTPEGGQVRVVAEEREGKAIIEVHDTGIGMDSEQMASLFQPFTRVHDAQAVDAAGTGLGLYICKGIIEGHGGRIDVESQGPGQGSSFRVTLPIRSTVAPAQETPGAQAPSKIVAGPLADRLRELI